MVNSVLRGKSGLMAITLALVGAMSAAWGALPADEKVVYGTNVWQGATSGGDWNDPANWRPVNAGTRTAADLLSLNCVYDIGALENGAVLTNNTADLKVAGLVTRSMSSQGTITLMGQSALLTGKTMFYINNAQTVVIWKLDHANNWTSKDGQELLLVLGAGTLRVDPPSVWQFYLREIQPCHTTTLELGSKCYLGLTYVRQWNNSTVRLLADITIGHLMCSDSGCKLDLNGHTLYVNCSEHNRDGMAYSGRIFDSTGPVGGVTFSGGDDWTINTAPAYTGPLTLYTGRVHFPAGLTMPATVFPVVNGSNRLIFNSSQTLARISGDGVAGGIQMPDTADSTLTLTGTGGVNEATTYNARLYGRDVVKTGADYQLTLTGDNCHSGATTVAAGTLTLQRPYTHRRGLVSCWTFDDPDKPGRDFGPSKSDLTFDHYGDGVVTQRFDGVDNSLALGLGTTGAGKTSGCGRASTETRTLSSCYPLRNDSLGVMLWYKPDPGNSAGPGYVFRLGNWGSDGGQFVLWQRGEAKMSWNIDNWDMADGDDSPQFDCPGLCDGNWHLLGATYDGVSRALKIYYDGVCVRTTKTTHPLNMANYRVVLGNNDSASNGFGSNHFIHGGYDDVSVWNRVLSPEEIAEEYARRAPVEDPAELLPAPLCHWAFDDASNVGKDSMGRADLVKSPNVSTTPLLSDRTGCYGRSLGWCAMALPEESQPAGFPVSNASFTVSIRIHQANPAENVDLLRIGGTNMTTSGTVDFLRLWYVNCPRRLQLSCGTVHRAFSWCGNYSARPGGWSHVVVTVDNAHGVMRIYRDGVQEASYTGFSVNLARGALYLNVTKPNGTSVTGSYIDDLRIYDTALDQDEVWTLGRSLETGKVGPVIPATSPVTVAAGACLRADGAQHAVKSLAGTGEVNVRGRLRVDDWSAFAGTVTGQGKIVLSQNGGTVPLAAASVTANVAFDDDVVALSSAQLATPRVRTTGHVRLPAVGTLKLTDAGARPGSWFGKTFKIAECASFSGATNTVGWTFDPVREEAVPEGTFFLQDGMLCLKTKGGGLVLTVR